MLVMFRAAWHVDQKLSITDHVLHTSRIPLGMGHAGCAQFPRPFLARARMKGAGHETNNYVNPNNFSI